MNYSELVTAIQDTVENDFSYSTNPEIINRFIQQAEQKIYAAVDLPAERRNSTALGNASQQYLGTPPVPFLYVYSLAITNGDDGYKYLLNKDVNFIRQVYPDPAYLAEPKYYALFDDNTFFLGPTPDSDYTYELHYAAYPESIVTAGTSYLGDEFDSVLLNGSLVEAIRYTKGEQDMVVLYDKMFNESMSQLKVLSDAKLRQDMYRSGQPRIADV